MRPRALAWTVAAFAAGTLAGAALLWATAGEGGPSAAAPEAPSILVRIENLGDAGAIVLLAVTEEGAREALWEDVLSVGAGGVGEAPIHDLAEGGTYDVLVSLRSSSGSGSSSRADLLVEPGSCGPGRPVLMIVRVRAREQGVALEGMEESCG